MYRDGKYTCYGDAIKTPFLLTVVSYWDYQNKTMEKSVVILYVLMRDIPHKTVVSWDWFVYVYSTPDYDTHVNA